MITRFPTLRLEGGLISSDQIDRVADQKGKELSIDDIAAAWSDIRSYWTLFEKSIAKLPEDNLATSETRNRWMIPFFSTLGYETDSKKRCLRWMDRPTRFHTGRERGGFPAHPYCRYPAVTRPSPGIRAAPACPPFTRAGIPEPDRAPLGHRDEWLHATHSPGFAPVA